MAVSFQELGGSPTYNVTRTKITAKRELLLDWADIDAFVVEQFPTGVYGPLSGGFFPGRPLLLVESIDIEPFVPDGPGAGVPPVYDGGAKVSVAYATPEFDQASNQADDTPSEGGEPQGANEDEAGQGQETTFITHRISVGAEVMTWPVKGFYKWERSEIVNRNRPATNEILDEMVYGIVIPTIEHQITWHFVPLPPWRAIREKIGMVNTRKFAGAEAECLLFLGVEATRETTNQGTRAWSLEYKFSEKCKRWITLGPNGTLNEPSETTIVSWNHFPREVFRTKTVLNAAAAQVATVHQIVMFQKVIDGNSKSPYLSTDFKDLFKRPKRNG